jgi:hypothetical protein
MMKTGGLLELMIELRVCLFDDDDDDDDYDDSPN